MSNFWKSLFTMIDVRLTPSSRYHRETDGQTEIVNKKLEEMLRYFVDECQSDWDELLVDAEVAYNSAPHSATTFNPYYLNYGMHPRTIPMDIVTSINPAANDFLSTIHKTQRVAQNAIACAQSSMEHYANRSRRSGSFEVGDLILLSTRNLTLDAYSGAHKIMPKACGPFKITEKISNLTARLDLPPLILRRGIHNAFHVSCLRPYFADEKYGRQHASPPPVQLSDGSIEYEVESTVRHRRHGDIIEYLVKWVGYPDHENTWQTAADLNNAPDLLAAYQHRVADDSASTGE
jgi:hypothetical protein